MLKIAFIRLISAIPVIFGVVIIVFVMLRVLPGDPVDIMATNMAMSAADMERLREQLGLNDPLWIQFVNYVRDLLRGDFGRSFFSNRPVAEQLLQQMPATIALTASAVVVAIVIGFPLGIIAAVRRNTWIDRAAMITALLGVSMPSFWTSILLIWLFGVTLRWLPIAGSGSLQHLILPSLALGLGTGAIIARLVRSSMLEVLGQDYITTARAKGLADRLVVIRHALRNALIPVITIVGLQVSTLLGGAVIVETIFSRRGIGTLVVRAVLERDFPVVQASIFLIAFTYILVNLFTDILYAYVDPRIRYQ
jgi:ABC-type dipeptide/oligopeptide/nickel transport system permease component